MNTPITAISQESVNTAMAVPMRNMKAYAEALPDVATLGDVRTVSPGEAGQRAFDISELTDTSIKVTRCWYLRGVVTKISEDDIIATLPASATTAYVAAKINIVTNAEIEIVSDADITVAFDTLYPSDSQYMKYPLYKLTRANTSAAWDVELDYRSLLPLVARI